MEGKGDVLDQHIDLSLSDFGDFFSNAGERVEVCDIGFDSHCFVPKQWFQLCCCIWIADDCDHEVLGILGELLDPLQLYMG
jgi:hypothetical protein